MQTNAPLLIALLLQVLSNAFCTNYDALNCPAPIGPCANYPQYSSLECRDGEPNVDEQMPVNFTVAFIGDQNRGTYAEEVLNLIKREGADMVIHSGDFDYINSPYTWETQITSILGANYPYFSSIGNHDVPAWYSTDGYLQKIYDRFQRLNITSCRGIIGVNMVCTYKGFLFVLSGVGTMGGNHLEFIQDSFERYPTIWKACSWHKNQNIYQTGSKADEVGYQVYDLCRRYGAIVATGHEHAYSRTYTMTNFLTQQFSASSDVLLKENQTFAFVSGVAGQLARPFNPGYNLFPYWAYAGASDTGLLPGSLFCKFNLNGEMRKAYCYFKQYDNQILDVFNLYSNVSLTNNTFQQNSSNSRVRIQVNSFENDGSQTNQGSNCAENVLYLGSGSDIILRFTNVPISTASTILNAHIEFMSLGGGLASTLFIYGDKTSNAVCQGANPSRVLTNSNVTWTPEAWVANDRYVTPDISPIITELLASGNLNSRSITFIIRGTGARATYSYEGGSCWSPTLRFDTPLVDITSGTVTTSQLTTSAIQVTTGGVTSGSQVTSSQFTSGRVTSGQVTSSQFTSGAVTSQSCCAATSVTTSLPLYETTGESLIVSDNSDRGAIAGGIIGGVSAFLFVASIVFLLIWKRRMQARSLRGRMDLEMEKEVSLPK